jgi:1-acyl-sn-glycerol-3-phosphate acyltransferase
MDAALTDLAERFRDRVDPRLVAMARPIVRALHALHPVRIDGLENLPDGPAILVGNHGLLGYETALFFERIYAETGRLPRGCADRWFFRIPLMRDVLVRVGGMYGCPQNAEAALGRGDLVVCYPGGAREVFKYDPVQRYRLHWRKSRGYAKVARRAKVPIVPFAAAGVDDAFEILARLRGSGRLLMGDDKYDLPLLIPNGRRPWPLPFWFRIGRPIATDVEIEALHEDVWSQAQTLLDGLVGEWRAENGASVELTSPRDAAASMIPACAY